MVQGDEEGKISLQTQMIAGFTRGTQQEPLPLLPSGSGGVHGVPLREARLSYSPANIQLTMLFLNKKKWRRDRDSNPGYAINVHTLSRRAPSTARTSLHISERYV